jgi:hypothetical protein
MLKSRGIDLIAADSCDPNFTLAQVGAVTRWTPSKT